MPETGRPHYHPCFECHEPTLCTGVRDHRGPTCIACRSAAVGEFVPEPISDHNRAAIQRVADEIDRCEQGEPGVPGLRLPGLWGVETA